ncbi:MAG: oligopeptide ABC transporter permease [Anaerolineaceae bacterium]|nr:oligopeptide ABC transporter permease [Anaerolineaceae bacterium]
MTKITQEKSFSLSPGRIAWLKLRKNKLALFGACVLILFILLSLLAPVISPYKIDELDLFNMESKPSAQHLLGTDDLGRDVLSRLLHGGRVSITVGILASISQVLIGTLAGAVAGYYGGIVDSIIMRIVDTIMCFPFFIVAIAMAAFVGPSLRNIIVIIAVIYWTNVTRIVRAEVLSLKKREFIDAAHSFGLSDFEIIATHIIPNVMAPLTVYATLAIANGILTEAALSYLGLGVKPSVPSWGNMLAAAQNLRVLQTEWWLWVPPGLMVLLTVLSINFLGDGLRDALDPKLEL